MKVEEEDFEEWDDDFAQKVLEAEEHVISVSQQQQKPPPPLLPSSHAAPLTHSPPRHLSQRSNAVSSFAASSSSSSSSSALPPRSSQLDRKPEIPRFKATASSSSALPLPFRAFQCDKELEIGRLNNALENVLEKLSHFEQECSDLKKERGKKDEQLKLLSSRNERKASGSTNLESGDIVLANHGSSRQFQKEKSSSHHPRSRVDIGVQIDETTSQASQNDDQHAYENLSKKLLAIWGSPNEQDVGRNLISNLLMACQDDFHSLSWFVGMNISSTLSMDTSRLESPFANSQYRLQLSSTPDAEKVSHLYSALAEVNNGMIPLDALFQPLVILCSLENVVIAQASLRILNVFLKHLLSLERLVEGRVNVMVEGLVRRNQTSYADSFPLQMDFSYAETKIKNGDWNNGIATLVSRVDWISLFQVIVKTSMRNTEQCIRLQAVALLNTILVRSNAFSEREKFGQTLVFEMIAKLLAKEAGFEVRKQAVQLLYMLLNCPKILVRFCSACKDEKRASAVDENAGDALTFQNCCMILEGLAECVACCENGLQELKLCQNAVLLLAFLASSGKSGFEIFASHKLPQNANFLILILQVLATEVDTETVVKEPQLYKERTLLIREALILLNRLASNPVYSPTVLRLLTHSRDMASLAVDVSSRLSRKHQLRNKFDSMQESDIGDLARTFKKRVFTYLGDSIS